MISEYHHTANRLEVASRKGNGYTEFERRVVAGDGADALFRAAAELERLRAALRRIVLMGDYGDAGRDASSVFAEEALSDDR